MTVGGGILGPQQGEVSPEDQPFCPPGLLDLGVGRPQPSGSPLGIW
jgi:hypothetical protein